MPKYPIPSSPKRLFKGILNTAPIIFTTIFITLILGVIGFGLWLRSDNFLEKPKNIEHIVVDNKITISWDVDEFASQGYTIYHNESKEEILVEQPKSNNRVSYTFEGLDLTKEYTFYIYANEVRSNNSDSAVVLYFGSKTAEYKYTPGE